MIYIARRKNRHCKIEALTCGLPITPAKQAGYCKYHHWTLSWPQIRHRRCLCKLNTGTWCRHFRPNLKHPSWENRDIPAPIRVKIEAAMARTQCNQS